jgi:glucokinase
MSPALTRGGDWASNSSIVKLVFATIKSASLNVFPRWSVLYRPLGAAHQLVSPADNHILSQISLTVKCLTPCGQIAKIPFRCGRRQAILKIMFLAIDIGGSKTLIAIFDDTGQIVEEYKFPTNKDYAIFLKDLGQAVKDKLGGRQFKVCAAAVPGQLDEAKSTVPAFGNLPWQNTPIKHDLETTLGYIPVLIENDAKLAALSEAAGRPEYKMTLYLTVSTGIGAGVVVDGKIAPILDSSEPGQMVLEFDGQLHKWEDIASGRALVAKYGKRASEIDDPAIWQEFSRALARGVTELIAVLQPDVIIFGGGVGAHFEKFAAPLKVELDKLAGPMVKTPPLIKAKRPEEAVIYGCYELIQQKV